MTKTQQVTARAEAFTALYNEFYAYFVEELRRDASPFNQQQLQLATQYFGGIELQNRVFPLFSSMVSTVAEKQACARAALYNALVAHSFGSHLASTSQTLFNVTNGLADEVAAIKKFAGSLSQQIDKIERWVGVFDSKLTKFLVDGKESKKHAISKRKQTVTRPEEGPEKQDDSLGS